ncbi:winged helix-turn-helix domain-containing protein [Saccharothrix sp. S26]|uniref:ArsR/SmtB family transcription factor n=1 Tax=Saccharothrix sp. S26 TaxID=2907215 RepID=UPI001F171BC5|nr:winged helix-turn-helix domain-containing protein [Saccharothrix sp. S26]MCE6997940.1 winged helix-turn-helix domain-containing protein [Saccharothrix sp. S26]
MAERRRRAATVEETKALAHPLRLRILRLCAQRELTNKQLAQRLGRDPGTVLYHVRQLAAAGFLEPGEVRTGVSGALKKPYRSTGVSWWLDGPVVDGTATSAPLEAFQEELSEAGPGSVRTYARFALHLSPDDVAELDRRISAVLDEYVATDDQRRHLPLHGGMVVVHRLKEDAGSVVDASPVEGGGQDERRQ